MKISKVYTQFFTAISSFSDFKMRQKTWMFLFFSCYILTVVDSSIRLNDKFSPRAWSSNRRSSSPITYIPFSTWLSRSNPYGNALNSIFPANRRYYKKPIHFVSNGKPIRIFKLETTTTSTTTTTTTTTTTQAPRKNWKDSSITWLGNFFMNGLPKKLFTFKDPYSPLYWFSHLQDMDKPSQNIV